MKTVVKHILDKYLSIYPEEDLRVFKDFVDNSSDKEVYDWNNFTGHIVASAFLYAKSEDKFLVLYHNDFKNYLYPGGHVDETDLTPLDAAKRETVEETSISDFKVLPICDDELIPIDIDIHYIRKNERLNLPVHYHFDFRYLFTIDKIEDVVIDPEESRDFKWVTIDEIDELVKSGNVVDKIRKLML